MLGEANAEVRALQVDGLVNARDLGGLPRRNGLLTPRGVCFRSENVDWVTAAGWDDVYAAGIRTVVDLRQTGERMRDTQRRPKWLITINVDLDGLDNANVWKDYRDNGLVGTAMYFLPHLAAMPERSATVLTALAGAPDGTERGSSQCCYLLLSRPDRTPSSTTISKRSGSATSGRPRRIVTMPNRRLRRSVSLTARRSAK